MEIVAIEMPPLLRGGAISQTAKKHRRHTQTNEWGRGAGLSRLSADDHRQYFLSSFFFFGTRITSLALLFVVRGKERKWCELRV